MVKKPALHRVLRVGIDLVHHLDDRVAAGEQDPLLAVGREAHVVVVQHQGLGDRDGLLAGALYVEAGLALALGAVHPLVVDPGQHHSAQATLQGGDVDVRLPGAHRLAVPLQHAHQAVGQLAHVLGLGRDIGTRRGPGLGDVQVGKVRRLARPEARLGDAQAERPTVLQGLHGRSLQRREAVAGNAAGFPGGRSRNLSSNVICARRIAIFFLLPLARALEDHIRSPQLLAKSVPPPVGSGARTGPIKR